MKGTAEGNCILIDLVTQVGIEDQIESNKTIKTGTIFIIQTSHGTNRLQDGIATRSTRALPKEA